MIEDYQDRHFPFEGCFNFRDIGGYLNKEQESAKKLKKLENIKIPKEFEFEKLHSISTEGRQKLKMIGPSTIGQASRISGVSPSDINVLLVYLGR